MQQTPTPCAHRAAKLLGEGKLSPRSANVLHQVHRLFKVAQSRDDFQAAERLARSIIVTQAKKARENMAPSVSSTGNLRSDGAGQRGGRARARPRSASAASSGSVGVGGRNRNSASVSSLSGASSSARSSAERSASSQRPAITTTSLRRQQERAQKAASSSYKAHGLAESASGPAFHAWCRRKRLVAVDHATASRAPFAAPLVPHGEAWGVPQERRREKVLSGKPASSLTEGEMRELGERLQRDNFRLAENTMRRQKHDCVKELKVVLGEHRQEFGTRQNYANADGRYNPRGGYCKEGSIASQIQGKTHLRFTKSTERERALRLR